MKVFFRHLFNVYPGEEKNAFLFAILAFLWALAVTSGLKFADALFLLHVGASSLPIAYICTALGMFAIALLLLRVFHTIDIHRIFISVILIGAGFYLFAYLCLLRNLGTESEWLWFALRIFGSLFFTVVVTCFWTFIDQYHHLQVAKRLYSLFSSMVFLGFATTGVIMRSGLIEFQHLTIIIAILLVITSFWIRKISKEVQIVHDENLESSARQEDHSFKFLVLSILKSPFTLLLMSGNFMTYLMQIVTEYNYMSSFDHYFDPTHIAAAGGEEGASLTLFLGQLIAVVSISNLIFGLFIYSRLVRRFGSTSLLTVTPTILLITFAGWSLNNSLLFPIMGFFVVEGTLFVIDDSNFNLVLNAVPTKLKYKIRVIIESFFEPMGMLLSAILISIPWVDSKILGLILSGCLLTITLLMQRKYFKAIYTNLAENAIHFQRKIPDWFKAMSLKLRKSAEFRLLAILKHADSRGQIFAAEGLINLDDEAILKKFLQEADRINASTKIKLIQLLSESNFANNIQVLDKLHEWEFRETDSELKSTIQFYFARLGLLHPEKVIQDLKSPNLMLKGAAIISLKKSWAQLPPHIATLNRTLAAQQLQQLIDSTDEAEICMGLTILGTDASPQDVDILIPFLKSPSIKVARSAAVSISQMADKNCLRHSPLLISELVLSKDNEFRLAILKVLGNIGDSTIVKDIIRASIHFRPNEKRATEAMICKMGLRTVPALLSITKDTTMHDRCRVLAGRILGRLALPQLRANLEPIISLEIERAYFYFYHHHTIQNQYPDLDLSILQDSLLASFHSVLDFIIQLLGVAGELEDCELLSRSLRSPNPKIRSQVVETLEKTCEIKIYRLLMPLVNDLPNEEKARAYLKEGGRSLSLKELLDKMSQSSTQLDQIIAATLKHRLNIPNWRSSLIQQMSGNEEIFHHFAYELLES